MKKVLSANNILLTVMIGIIAIMSPTNVGADNSITGEITVSCYDSMVYKSFLEYAAKSFEAKHPKAKVNIDAFSTMPEVKTVTTEDESGAVTTTHLIDYKIDSQAQSDYIIRVNTEIMSGRGADIYAIDVLPYYKYADSGMFEGLRQFMDNDPDFNYKDYQKNIFDAVIYKEEQYILPLDYEFYMLSYNTSLMDTDTSGKLKFGEYKFDKLMDLGFDSFVSMYDSDMNNQIKLFNRYTGYDDLTLFRELFNVNYNSFVDLESKNAYFTNGRFTQILNKVKEFRDKGYISDGPGYVDYLFKIIGSQRLLEALCKDDIANMGGGTMPVFPSSQLVKDDELIGLLVGDNGEFAFNSTQTYAMNVNSKNKDTAWAFLKYLLGDEIQSSRGLRYIPVNKNIAAQKSRYSMYNLYFNAGIKLEGLTFRRQDKKNESEEAVSLSEGVLDMAGSSVFDLGNAQLTKTQQEIYETYMDYIDRYAALINTYTTLDIIIDEMIETEVAKFFDGSRTADEVASVLQNKVSMYLQE